MAKLCASSSVKWLRYQTKSSAFTCSDPWWEEWQGAHIIRLQKKKVGMVYIYIFSLFTLQKSLMLPDEAKRSKIDQHSWGFYAYRPRWSLLSFGHRDGFFPSLSFSCSFCRCFSLFLNNTFDVNSYLNDTVEHVHATVCLKCDGLWLLMVSKGEFKRNNIFAGPSYLKSCASSYWRWGEKYSNLPWQFHLL